VIGNYISAHGTDLWFTDFNNSMVWRYDTVTGAFTYFQTPTRPSNPHDVAVDASGIVWFTESNVGAIARLDPATGTITETPVSGSPRQLAISPIDGVVWFTDRFNHTVGRLDPTTNEVLVFALPAASGPEDIAVTPAGEVWFTQSVAGNAAQISADGVVIAEGKIVKSSEPFGIAIGHDGTSIWYAMLSADKIGVLMSK
jgi:streptogramin lyase